MRDRVDQLAHHIRQIVGRIEAAVQAPTTCCSLCGCLLRRGEATCPNCALTNVRRAS